MARRQRRPPTLNVRLPSFSTRTSTKRRNPSSSKERFDHPVYWRREAAGRWRQRIFDQYVPLNENLPVIHVSWYEAEAYCNWADRRLPTEAEWEAAASAEPTPAGDGLSDRRRHFPWGDDPPTSERANLDWRSGPVEVGAHPSGDSAFGCRQMIGNVWEWTADDFMPYPDLSLILTRNTRSRGSAPTKSSAAAAGRRAPC